MGAFLGGSRDGRVRGQLADEISAGQEVVSVIAVCQLHGRLGPGCAKLAGGGPGE